MKRLPFTLLVAAVAALSLAQAPKTANTLVESAIAVAKQTNRVPFVRFTASWCGWCHRMEGVLTSKAVKPIWDKYFVTQPIVVLENGDKEKLENPGGEELMASQGGKDQGIPYFYFVDPKTGKTIATSLRPASGSDKGGNVGCPYEPAEIEFFMGLISKAAPKMTASEKNTVRSAFAELKKADKKG